MPIRDEILEEISHLFEESGRVNPVWNEDSMLLGPAGLDSLDLAVLVVRLEKRFGQDPFNDPRLERYPRTFGELVELYESGLSSATET